MKKLKTWLADNKITNKTFAKLINRTPVQVSNYHYKDVYYVKDNILYKKIRKIDY